MKQLFFSVLFLVFFSVASFAQIGFLQGTQALISRDQMVECCSGNNYTLALAESSYLTGRRASISFHNAGQDEGKLELSSDGGFRNLKLYDNQGYGLGLNVTGNVLIGNTTTKPGYKLFVEQGILTDKLEVSADAYIKGYLTSSYITVLPQNNVSEGGEILLKGSASNLKDYHIDNLYNSFRIFTGNSVRFIISDTGNTGIGTNNPDEKLTVKGKIHAEEIRVDLQVPADYVFEKYYTGESSSKPDYKILPLAEVEKYTKINNHLPDVPSALEIKEKGLQVGQMSNVLLQKVEELTLYIIEINKKIVLQEQQNEVLKQTLLALQKEIKH
jgi:hypothetical protein